MRLLKKLTLILTLLVLCLSAIAQNQQQETKDSLVVLLSSKSAQMVDVEGSRYRKVIGPARFLHNNTYLICDTALWNVETQIIDAWGNVSILQEETVLTSDKLKYLVDNNLAQFRGSVVQLTDKDHNTLRTRFLDYNTQDSIAVFTNGGSMRDKDGQIIESRNGTYDSKVKKFTFENDVNMFTDSIFVKTKELVYESDRNLATFGFATDAWQDDNMLSSNRGWYDRSKELFFFTDNDHVMSQDQEGWCDSLYFSRLTSNVEMLGNAQVTDTTRNVFGLAGKLEYVDSISKVTLTRKPAVISQNEEADGSIDTVYLGADKLVYYTLRMCDIPEAAVADADKRLKSLETDPVGTFRQKAAQEAAKAAAEAAKNDPNRPPQGALKNGPAKKLSAAPPDALAFKAPADTLAMAPAIDSLAAVVSPVDSLSNEKPVMSVGRPDMSKYRMRADSLSAADSLPVLPGIPDSLGAALPDTTQAVDSAALAAEKARADSLARVDSLANLDTTKIGFLEAIGKVKIYKKSMQVVCDSLLYSDLDSLARLFKEPIIWQEVTRQYSADSVSLVVQGGSMEKASLMSNAFITIQEDAKHFDQIKGAEMLAFFTDKGQLERFDVLGGASAMFFLEENGAFATVNKTDSKMLSAVFKDGELQRVYYFEQAKNDGYPVVQLPSEEQQLKGFNWHPEKRPADRYAVTPLSLRPSERLRYAARPRAQFRQTDFYFPGYMDDVYRQIEVKDSLRRVRERERAIAERQAAERARLDSLALKDSLALADSLSLSIDSLAIADSLAASLDSLSMSIDSLALADSLVISDSLTFSDSLAVADSAVVLTPEEIAAKAKAEAEAEKARQKAEKERLRAEKKAEVEAKRKARQEAKEARWAELDKRDAEKAAAKAEKLKEKERQRKRKALEKAAREAEKDNEALERYKRQFEKQKAKEAEKAAKAVSRKK
jgi:hypothetical protein